MSPATATGFWEGTETASRSAIDTLEADSSSTDVHVVGPAGVIGRVMSIHGPMHFYVSDRPGGSRVLFADDITTRLSTSACARLLGSYISPARRVEAILRHMYPSLLSHVLHNRTELDFNTSVQMATITPEPPPIETLVNTTDYDSTERLYLSRQMADAFAAGALEDFEPGMDSAFAQRLGDFIDAYGPRAVRAVEPLLVSDTGNREVVGEALKALGHLPHESTRKQRFELLQECLRSKFPRTRYAAALGLAAMDDEASLGAIAQALARETDTTLRRYLQRVLEQVEETRRCPA